MKGDLWELSFEDKLKYDNKTQGMVYSLMKDWHTTINEAVDNELKDYLNVVHNVDTDRLKEYSSRFNNIKLLNVDIESKTFHLPDGVIYTEWVDNGRLIFTTRQELKDYVYTFNIESFWRKDGV